MNLIVIKNEDYLILMMGLNQHNYDKINIIKADFGEKKSYQNKIKTFLICRNLICTN